MAVKNIRVDDMDKASVATDTIPFAYRGKQYEIDLSAINAKQFDTTMMKWIDASRVISGGKKPAAKKTTTNGSSNGNMNTTDKTEYYAAVREWARKNAIQVHDRGRIPTSVIEGYEASKK